MANQIIARKNAQWVVVSLAPDVCKTPIGNITPPIPYPVIARLGDAVKTAPQVRANGADLVLFDQSKLPQTLGDVAGVAKGIKSGTVGGACYPKGHSGSVKAGGKPILRHDDEFWMNGP